MIGLIDYRMGNLRSVEKALQRFDAPVSIVRTPAELSRCSKLILPGVGAFADAMTHLRDQQLVEPLRDFAASGKPFLGICLGLQLLFDTSEEDGTHQGLSILPGRVIRFAPADPTLKVPHMGWNALSFTQRDNPLFAGLSGGAFVYFVHSYYAQPADPAATSATAEYDGAFCAAVRKGNVFATQFHPEKSQRVGLKMLENFTRL